MFDPQFQNRAFAPSGGPEALSVESWLVATHDRPRHVRAVDLPVPLLSLVERTSGAQAVSTTPVSGGISTAIKSKVELSDGSLTFLKACPVAYGGSSYERLLYEIDVNRFRRGGVRSPRFLDALVDGDWAALATEFVVGRDVDLSDQNDFNSAWVSLRLAGEPPKGAVDLPDRFKRLSSSAHGWLSAMRDLEDDGIAYVPPHLRAAFRRYRADLDLVPAQLAGDVLCHWDMTPGNLICTGPKVILVDWGLARVGPSWCDLYKLSVEATLTPALAERLRAEIPLPKPRRAIVLLSFLLGVNYVLRAEMHRRSMGEALYRRRLAVAEKLFHAVEVLDEMAD